MGVTWAHETADELGVLLADVAAAYWAARQVLTADQRWRRLEAMASHLSTDTELVLHQRRGVDGQRPGPRLPGPARLQLQRFVRQDWPAASEVVAAAGILVAGDEGGGAEIDALVGRASTGRGPGVRRASAALPGGRPGRRRPGPRASGPGRR